ncbi:hypothetical protein Tco_0578791 [Tanacetum coccineum]
MTDYSLWEKIADRRNEMKARGTLLMALLNKDQLKFHSYKDAKLLMEAIEKRYGGNKESKKVQRTLLKQQYENFAGLSSETMDQTFDRLQKLITQLEIQGSSSTSQNPQNVAFVSSNSTNSNSSTNEADNTAYGPNSPQISQEDLEQIDPDDLEEMDLQWEMAMLTIRARRFIKRARRKLDVNSQRVGFDRGREINRRTVTVETPTKNALVAQDGIRGYDWSYQAEEEHPTNFALMALTSLGSSSSSDSEVDSCSKSCVKAYATLKEKYDNLSSDYKNQVSVKFKTRLGFNADSSTAASPIVESFVNSSKMLENPENNKSKSDKGYHAVPSPYTGNFMSYKPDLTFMDEIVESENCNGDGIMKTLKPFRNNRLRPPVIEDWNSNDESYKTSVEHSSRVNHKNFANKMTHPHPNRIFVPQEVLTKSSKINTAGASVNTAVRPVNNAGSKPTVNYPRPISNAYKKGYLQVTRPFNKATHNRRSTRKKELLTVVAQGTCLRNRCYLTEYEDYNGGFVSFGDGKGRISRKATVKSQVLLREEASSINMIEGTKKQQTYKLIIRSIDVNAARYVLVLPMAVNTASLIFEGRLVLPVHVNAAITKG